MNSRIYGISFSGQFFNFALRVYKERKSDLAISRVCKPDVFLILNHPENN